MATTLIYLSLACFVLLAGVAAFFFVLTRGALLLRLFQGKNAHETAHIYPLYSDMRLIKLVDYQPLIAAILLFQYDRLVSLITQGLSNSDLRSKTVLVTSCAFGNVVPRVVQASVASNAHQVVISDLIENELDNARNKTAEFSQKLTFVRENALALQQADASVSANVIFFLLHELPHPLKARVLQEAMRVLEPGGKLYIAEFHRPDNWPLRALSWLYFRAYEPFGLALWDTHDPQKQLEALGAAHCEKHTVFFGNYQVLVATK